MPSVSIPLLVRKSLRLMATVAVLATFGIGVPATSVTAQNGDPVRSSGGMVSSQQWIASQVGADVLASGGNAVDAAIATGFALSVPA